MIRNVVMVRLRPEADPAEVAATRQDFLNLSLPGTLSYTLGEDLGLREGNWSLAIVADFTDIDAYQGYDADAAHNRARARLAPLTAEIARVQFEVP